MDNTRIIQQGETAKFQITIADFDMDDNDFKVELIYGYRRTIVEIPKEKMVENEGLYYFSFDTDDMVGLITARCTWYLEDTDVDDSLKREKCEEQYLCFIVTAPCPRLFTCPCDTTNHKVTYTRNEQSNIAQRYLRLQDTNGQNLVTADNQYIYVYNQYNNN